MPKLKITKGRLGAKTKKIDPDEDMKDKNKDKLLARDIKGMDEFYWAIEQQKQSIDKLKAELEKLSIYDLIYESFELYTDSRKRMQIELLKELSFQLKREFNKEFDQLVSYKED